MQPLPHHYVVRATGGASGNVDVAGDRLPSLSSAAPAEFGGPGDRWSPETLLLGAIGDCLILTFRAVARASRVPWTSLHCAVTGILDTADGVLRFTRFDLDAQLIVPAGTDVERARLALKKAEQTCLISNSLKGTTALRAEVVVASEAVDTFA